jgi:CBS domain-containing protein
MKVQDAMTGNVKFCRPEVNLATAAGMMWENDCGVIPVVDGVGKVIGMITDRDIAMAMAMMGHFASDIAVSEVMSQKVYACALNDDIKSALKTMRHEKVRRLPVVNDDGVLQGILCLNDVALRAEEAKGKHIPDLSYEDVMSTLKAICEHRISHKSAHAQSAQSRA